jgi:hypothetical protein
MTNLDDLELELRRLPGVLSTGFDVRSDMLLVQLHVLPERGHALPSGEASRIAARHADRPIAVELIRLAPNGTLARAELEPPEPAETELDVRPPHPVAESAQAAPRSRPRLLAVLAFPDRDELEVHLVHEGRRTIGRASASLGIAAAVEATIDAVRALGTSLDARTRWCRTIDTEQPVAALVAVALDVDEGATTYGLAGGDTEIDAAARSTLDALNRRFVRLA